MRNTTLVKADETTRKEIMKRAAAMNMATRPVMTWTEEDGIMVISGCTTEEATAMLSGLEAHVLDIAERYERRHEAEMAAAYARHEAWAAGITE